MDFHWSRAAFLLALTMATWCQASPVYPEDEIDNNVDKRTLDDSPSMMLAGPFAGPYAYYPPMSGLGIKPLRPILPPGFFLNRFATTPPTPMDPMASFFKARKEEFLNKLFDDITIATTSPELQVRSIVDPSAEDDSTSEMAPSTTTAKPKVDPSAFITKKFDFLAALFKTLNTTTTPTPTSDPASTDPTATTVKPTIVPPGFWVPVPKTPKPPKATKPPKPEKAKSLLLEAIDEGLLKGVLAAVDPSNPALTPKSAVETRQVTFLDKLLHRVTDEPPTEEPILDSRSLAFPPGYWIPPYIYAAKMGIYLDKMFDTIDKAAAEDSEDVDELDKRSADPSSMILAELTSLKNDMLAAYLEGLKAAKTTPTSAKPAPKKPLWGPKTTPTPDPAQQKAELLSDVFDKLAAVQAQILAGPEGVINVTSTGVTTTPTPTPDFWAPDPAAVDISEYYKSKTQEFLSNLFASKMSTTPATE